MATINLGRVKPVFRGAYAGGTAYVVDDIVTSGNETFICIQASTGNATSNASYWTKLAAKGTDGTDVGTTITTQGDILYRDGSGLARLAAGTSGQFLKTQGSGANPVWADNTVSSVFEKIDSGNFSSVSYIDLDGTSKWGTANTYLRHKIIIYNLTLTESANIFARQIDSGTLNTSNIYSSTVSQRNSGNTTHSAAATDAGDAMQFTHDNLRGANHSANSHSLEFEIGGMHKVGSSSGENQLQILYRSTGSNHDGNIRKIAHRGAGISPQNDGSNTNRTGLRIYWGSGNATGSYVIYGYKL